MAKVLTDDKHYKDIAQEIRACANSIKGIKPEEMAGAVYGVLAKGRQEGYEEGKSEGIADGKQTERDNFWSVYLNYGNSRNYQHAFSNGRFTDEIYNPTYPIYCTQAISVSAQYMFSGSELSDTKVEIIIGAGRGLAQTFQNNNYLHTIRKLTLLGNNTFNSTFSNCPELQNITIEGTISNDISFADSPKLTQESITNIVSCLSDDVSGKTLALSIMAVAEGFAYDNMDANGVDSAEWAELIATKPNWTISLV